MTDPLSDLLDEAVVAPSDAPEGTENLESTTDTDTNTENSENSENSDPQPEGPKYTNILDTYASEAEMLASGKYPEGSLFTVSAFSSKATLDLVLANQSKPELAAQLAGMVTQPNVRNAISATRAPLPVVIVADVPLIAYDAAIAVIYERQKNKSDSTGSSVSGVLTDDRLKELTFDNIQELAAMEKRLAGLQERIAKKRKTVSMRSEQSLARFGADWEKIVTAYGEAKLAEAEAAKAISD